MKEKKKSRYNEMYEQSKSKKNPDLEVSYGYKSWFNLLKTLEILEVSKNKANRRRAIDV